MTHGATVAHVDQNLDNFINCNIAVLEGAERLKHLWMETKRKQSRWTIGLTKMPFTLQMPHCKL